MTQASDYSSVWRSDCADTEGSAAAALKDATVCGDWTALLGSASECRRVIRQADDMIPEEVEVSVIIPCLNEEKTLGGCIRQAQEALRAAGLRGEVIVSDNGSSDGSVRIAESLGARVVQQPQRGYGNALRRGFEAARGRFLIMGDADMSYDFGEIPRFVEKLREGHDLVMGSRFKGRILPGAMPWKNQWIGNPILTRLLNLFFGTRISDAHCGLRGLTKDAFERLRLQTPGMEFASEMVVKAGMAKMRITEVPVVLHPDGRERPPHLRPWRDGWRHLKFMLMFSPTFVFFIPGVALMSLGLFFLVSQLFAPAGGPLLVGRVRMDYHWSIAGSLLVLVGYHVVNVHYFAKIYGIAHGLREADRVTNRLFNLLTLERVLVVGLLIALVGLVADVAVIVRWIARNYDFGAYARAYTRLGIFGSTLIAIGVATMFNAFFFSILGDPTKYGRR
jgi:glycosyltransferase involved in cell wall biosynthesis